jgi:uncharacterized repeat protein (TIGR03837 family)
MLWDLFCRVIDNFGDMGVCWRLASDLGQRGHQVRLWVDDARILQWMAPQVSWSADADLGQQTGRGQAGVTVCHWADAEALSDAHPLVPGDVVIETFGCHLPDAFVARMQRPSPPQWVNLEYLSAEDYVERSHGLPSPVWHGPGAGLRKRFYYPGFTPATGGLLRETDLLARRATWDDTVRQTWLRQHGIPWAPGDRVVSIFCYANAPVDALLTHLAASPQPAPPVTHVLLAHGHATELGHAWEKAQTHIAALPHREPQAAPGEPRAHLNALRLHSLPALPQAEFDHLLWSSDLNFVRGEDSAVRALWAGRPHVWQIYEQDDGVHADKLDAFMNRWMRDWPAQLSADVRALWRGWNGLGPLPASLPAWQSPQTGWAQHTLDSHQTLLKQTDLVTQLIHFVTQTG